MKTTNHGKTARGKPFINKEFNGKFITFIAIEHLWGGCYAWEENGIAVLLNSEAEKLDAEWKELNIC